MTAHHRSGLWHKLPLFGRKHQARARDLAKYAKRSQLRVESLESRYVMDGTHLDLVSESDLGFSNTDDLTSATTWTMQGQDLTVGAAVRIMHNGEVVASGNAIAATLNMQVDVSALPDGALDFTIEQDTGSGFVAGPHVWTFTKDTAIGEFTSTAPTALNVGTNLNYNVEHPEEGAANALYSLESGPAGASIDPETGVITWTPGEADIDTYSFGIKMTDAAGNEKIQTVNLTVKPTAPTAPDLTDASDSGPVNDDNVTGAATLSFTVGGLLATAQTVNLKVGNTVIGTIATGGASSVDVLVTDPTLLGQGDVIITAEQIVDGIASDVSASITIKRDTQIAAITGTPPTTGTVNTLITYDAGHNEETDAGFVYELENEPTGAVISAAGVVTWTPAANQTGVNAFTIRATDLAGNTITQALSITVSAATPGAPTAPDLKSTSDSGSSQTDNVTGSATLVFTVGGIDPTATVVNLKVGSTIIGTINPAGATSVDVSVANVAGLGQGQVNIVAEQIVGGITSPPSALISIVYDSQIAAITGTPPTAGIVGAQITYDAGNAEENQTGFVYSLEGAPQGASISAAGVLTWTPAGNQTGVNNFTIRATDLAGNTVTQVLGITVSATAPTPGVPDLQAASDSGTSSTDNVTNATSWTLDVSGVTAGATVNIKHNGTIVGTGVASGTTISITISNVSTFADGDVALVAEQVIGSVTSAASAALTVKKDTAISAITSTPGAFATAGTLFTYDAAHAEETTPGVVYSLVNAPTGMTIVAGTGVVSWTPSAANQVGSATFGVRATDAAGNATTQTVNLEVLRPVPALDAHMHYDLSIFVNGTLVNIPNFLGIGQSGQIAFPHVEGNDNRIHVHPMDGTNATPTTSVTLGDFFTTWRTNAGIPGNNPNATFSSTSLMGNNVVAGTSTVRMYVNGKLSTEFENYVPRDEDDITLTFETVGAATGPTLQPIQNITIQAGAPMYIPLLGFDPTGQNITFSATASNPSLVTTGISNTNRSMKITVAGFGDMYFELFEDKAPDIVAKIIALANAGNFDNTIFHRVINGFMIQGGDPNGNGSNDENQPEFDDQFHLDLQHTSSGLLSMAKAGDDTNTSQFFITDTATRFLDFNHSIFGRLVEGDNVREAISNVATNSSDRPLTNVTMSNVEIYMDPSNGVLMLKAAHGATGTSNVTVTATDADGNTFQQTFAVTVQADTTNTPPFLNPVSDITASAGTPVNVQLSASDVEGDTRLFAIDPNNIDGSSKPYTATINSATGLVTITPNTGFVGSFNITLGVRQDPTISGISDQWDTQTITVTVNGSTPNTPDLLDASDTGTSNSDNITRAGSWQFLVSNVTAGATVKLFNGATEVGSAVASGNTVVVTIADTSSFADGAVQITARQIVTVNGTPQTSPLSLPLTVTKDTVAPVAFDFSSPLPTTAIVGQVYSYNFVNPDETQTGFTYAIASSPTPPAGVSINPTTGVVTWTPTTAQIGAQTFKVTFSDPAGNLREHTVNASVISDQSQLVQFTVSITDLNGNPITEVEQGEDFLVRVLVEDIRATPTGLFSAYADMTYESTKVAAVAPIIFGDSYPNARSGSLTTVGIVDEAGGTANITPLGGDRFVVYTTRFTATGLGTTTFATNPADDAVPHPILLFNVGSVIPNAQVTHGSRSLSIVAPDGAVADELTVGEDSTNNTLNVLSNDTIPDGETGPFFIDSVTQPTSGGTVTISTDKLTLLFTPTPDFAGETTFTYTVKTAEGFTDTATVTLTVTNSNDPPTANDDTLTINEDQANAPLNVLANDSFAPDPVETLIITAVTQPTTGGTVSIAADGKSLVFNPTANFNGQVTFTYTINDGTPGSNDTATVTLNITPVNDNPTANPDTLTVAEDAGATTLDVLANDSFAPDVGETLTIVSVSAGSQGSTITIGTGGNVIYTPAANINGTETFTYTIGDGNGGSATGTVTVTITPVNDPPNAVDDTATAIKNGGPLTINVLANDSALPDTGETLTITAVTQPTTGGTITIASDNKSLIYTPTADFSGTVTFTYTISDGTAGSTDTATVTITVQDFIPSDIAGFVYIDANNNGVRDAGEVGLAGVVVTLSGTSSTGASVNQTATTVGDGSYKFINVAPGSYGLQQTQPSFMVDGRETLGSHGGSNAVNDRMTFTIAQDSHLTGYNFGEQGREARFVTMRDFLTSTPVGASMSSVNASGTVTWIQLGPSFAANTIATGTLNTAKTILTLNITENGQQFTTTMAMNDATKVQTIGEQSGALLLRIIGTRSSLGFTPVSSGGEGEASLGAAEGEAPSLMSYQSSGTPVTNDASSHGLPQAEGEASSDEYDLLTATVVNAALSSSSLSADAYSTQTDTAATSSYVSPASTYNTSGSSTATADSSSGYANDGSDSSKPADEEESDDETEKKQDKKSDDDAPPAEEPEATAAWDGQDWSWLSDAEQDDDAEAAALATDLLMTGEEWA